MSPAEARHQLQRLIRESGIGLPDFARSVLARNPRTLERWLSGDSPISPVVQSWLERVTVVRRSDHHLTITVRLTS